MTPNRFRAWAWKQYRRSSGLKHSLLRRFTPAGLLTVVIFGGLIGLGVDTNLSIAYQAASLFGATLLVAVGWAFVRRPAFKAERLPPRFGTAGSPLRYRVTITNPTRQQ